MDQAELTNVATASPADLIAPLERVLAGILAAKGGLPDDVDLSSATFTSLDFNSVDYLEFVLNVEADLNVDIPDEAVLDPSLCSVTTWAAWLATHAAELTTPAIGTPALGASGV
jgi:acyl carrier protein